MVVPDLTFSNVTSHSKQLRKIFTMTFTTSKRVEAAHELRAEEFRHMLSTIPQEGWVNVKFHLEVLAGNVFSQLIMGKRLLQPSSMDEEVNDSTEKLKDLMTITADLDRILGTFNPGDFIPAFKKLDLQGLGSRFTQFRARLDSFIGKILEERLEVRKNRKDQPRANDYLDALLDEADQPNNDIDLNVVKTMLWVTLTPLSSSLLSSPLCPPQAHKLGYHAGITQTSHKYLTGITWVLPRNGLFFCRRFMQRGWRRTLRRRSGRWRRWWGRRRR
jgi:hypothetical protein